MNNKRQDILLKIVGFFLGLIVGSLVFLLWRYLLFMFFGWPFRPGGFTPLFVILGFGYLGWKHINSIIKQLKTLSIVHLEKKTGRLQIVLFVSWLIISITYIYFSGNRDFDATITWGSISRREENTLKLIFMPLVFILMIPFFKKLIIWIKSGS